MTTPDTPFADFQLDGFDSSEARRQRPLVVLVWRTGCSTSCLTLPFIDRLASRLPGAEVVGVSQDDAATTTAYCEANAIGMRQLHDANLAVTRGFGLTSVPFFALTGAEGKVLECGRAWDVERLEAIAKQVAALLGTPYTPIVTEADQVPVFKPG